MSEKVRASQLIIKTVEGSNGLNKLIVNSHGARINELFLSGQKILTYVKRGDGKEGSTHPCVPIFGPETTTSFNIPQHGSARNIEWKNYLQSNAMAILALDIKDGKYPEGLKVGQTHMILDGEYSLSTELTNNSFQFLPANFAEHFYWNAPKGWEGLEINGINVTDIVKSDGAILIKPENEILIPGQKPIILKQQGFSIFQLWVYKNPQTGEYDKEYVCIEPAEGDPKKDFFGSPESMIKPHQTRATRINIRLK